jgi:hypothetical protein
MQIYFALIWKWSCILAPDNFRLFPPWVPRKTLKSHVGYRENLHYVDLLPISPVPSVISPALGSFAPFEIEIMKMQAILSKQDFVWMCAWEQGKQCTERVPGPGPCGSKDQSSCKLTAASTSVLAALTWLKTSTCITSDLCSQHQGLPLLWWSIHVRLL